jgi:hypothetical protein
MGSDGDDVTVVEVQEGGKLAVGGSSNCEFVLVRYFTQPMTRE